MRAMSVKPSCEELEQRLKEIETELAGLKHAEGALRKAKRRLTTLLDFIPYAFVVYDHEGKVFYLNPAFTETFGWTLEELEGRHIPFIPPDLKEDTARYSAELYKNGKLQRHETRRLTKDGRILDVTIRAVAYPASEAEAAGSIAILRDITEERRLARINETILRISTALPEYPELEELLSYVTSEIMDLTEAEGSVVLLLDEEREQLFVLAPSYEDQATESRVREVRFNLDELVAGRVVRSGEPIIVSDTSVEAELHAERDRRLGYHTRNLLLVPLKGRDRISGVLCALNKKHGEFGQQDIEMLNIVGGTVALSIENARYSEQVRKALQEVQSLNRAKDKMINHLAHELETPVAILLGSLGLLEKHLADVPREQWVHNMERLHRNLKRISAIQLEVQDIMEGREGGAYTMLSLLLDQCAEEIEVLAARETGIEGLAQTLRERVEAIFGPRDMKPVHVNLKDFVEQRLASDCDQCSHRRVNLEISLENVPDVKVPLECLEKVFDGLLRNAVENTPDGSTIEIEVKPGVGGVELVVRDYGVGIADEAKRRIFEGFFSTQDTLAYSSRKPFDFNAGGKGADLLRMKIFSERYGFKIRMDSNRCKYLPGAYDVCPGSVEKCSAAPSSEECRDSGGTSFTVFFPRADRSPSE
ncbi:MAG TPA: PAS domain S-box protein [Desulfobacteraceae bacterium]|nr:PAS domain S-box protein [Desulfobacteraceae bacterium]